MLNSFQWMLIFQFVMFKQKRLWLLILFSILELTLIQCDFLEREPDYQRHRFKSIKCLSENTTIFQFKYCRIKVTRNSSMIAFNVTFIPKNPRPFNLRMSMSYKYGLIYREVFKVPQIEVCAVLKNFNLMPPFLKALFDVLGDSIAPFLKGCPYIGDMYLLLEADSSKFPSIFPTGMYRLQLTAETTNTKLFRITAEAEMITSIKTSF